MGDDVFLFTYEDLANKDMKDMVFFGNSPKDIVEDYFHVLLHTMVNVLKVIDKDELEFKIKEV